MSDHQRSLYQIIRRWTMTQDPVSTSNIDIEDPHRFRVRRLLTFGLPIFFLQHLLFTVFFCRSRPYPPWDIQWGLHSSIPFPLVVSG
jgi:hypothetical protein